MQAELLWPVASALKEMEKGSTPESIYYNYLQHCRNITQNRADPAEEQLLPELNRAIIDRWGTKVLVNMKKRVWQQLE
jgi:hypothetical protein